MTRLQIEYSVNAGAAKVRDSLESSSDGHLVELFFAVSNGEPIEQFFKGSTSDEVLRYLAKFTVLRELWRRLDVAEMEAAEGRSS